MNFVTTRHSSNKFGSALAAPKFSDLLEYLDILLFKKARRQDICFYYGYWLDNIISLFYYTKFLIQFY